MCVFLMEIYESCRCVCVCMRMHESIMDEIGESFCRLTCTVVEQHKTSELKLDPLCCFLLTDCCLYVYTHTGEGNLKKGKGGDVKVPSQHTISIH